MLESPSKIGDRSSILDSIIRLSNSAGSNPGKRNGCINGKRKNNTTDTPTTRKRKVLVKDSRNFLASIFPDFSSFSDNSGTRTDTETIEATDTNTRSGTRNAA